MLLYLSSIICMYVLCHACTNSKHVPRVLRTCILLCFFSLLSLYSKNFFRSSFKCNSKQLSKAKSKATLLRFC